MFRTVAILSFLGTMVPCRGMIFTVPEQKWSDANQQLRIVWSDDYEKTERSVLERAFSAVSEKGSEMDRILLWRELQRKPSEAGLCLHSTSQSNHQPWWHLPTSFVCFWCNPARLTQVTLHQWKKATYLYHIDMSLRGKSHSQILDLFKKHVYTPGNMWIPTTMLTGTLQLPFLSWNSSVKTTRGMWMLSDCITLWTKQRLSNDDIKRTFLELLGA